MGTRERERRGTIIDGTYTKFRDTVADTNDPRFPADPGLGITAIWIEMQEVSKSRPIVNCGSLRFGLERSSAIDFSIYAPALLPNDTHPLLLLDEDGREGEDGCAHE